MCLLTFFPAGVMPDLAALQIGTHVNDDGHGFAIVAGDRLLVQRGMDAELLLDAFDTLRHQHPGGPALFHSRLATHGHRDLDNCHPFPVGGDQQTVLAHNGVLPAMVQPANGDSRSDTRIVAEDFLPRFGSLRHRRTRIRLERWMSRANKMVVLSVDRRFRKQAFILNEAAGIWDGGIWYSNDAYLPQPSGRWMFPQRWWNEPIDRCELCRLPLDATAAECRWCGWCPDCRQPPEDCLCYRPAVLYSDPGI